MSKLTTLFLFLLLLCINATAENKIVQDVQIFTAKNHNHTITPKTIESSFDSVGLSVAGNNDMNIPFKKRFQKVHYKTYNLAMFMNNELSYRLLKKYPSFGALTPLTMSIWQDEQENINVATLSYSAMARVTGIPATDPDLRAYAALIHKALKKAMPQGDFKKIFSKPTHQNRSLQINFSADVDLGEDVAIEDFIDDFEAEFEGEMEPLGFLFPNYTNVQEEIFDDHNYTQYDFYHTYSICKFDVIYPVSKYHPEAGAWAPCSFYIYKKKGEPKMHMGFLSVENWITSLDIRDKKSINALQDAQAMIIKILKDMTD